MAEKKRQEDEVCTTGIIVSARQIEADILPIIDGAIVSPRYQLRARKATTTLYLVKIQKIPQQCGPL
jgi:hypothetical protein